MQIERMNISNQHMRIGLMIMIIFLFYGCSPKSKNELFIGKWKLTSRNDLIRNKIREFHDDSTEYVNVTHDSIFIYYNSFKDKPDKYTWKLQHDTIFVTINKYNVWPFKIISLDENNLEVEERIHLKNSTDTSIYNQRNILHFDRVK